MFPFVSDPPQGTIGILGMRASLEEAHGILHFQDMSQDHTRHHLKRKKEQKEYKRSNYATKKNLYIKNKSNKEKANYTPNHHPWDSEKLLPLTCRSLIKVDLAWLSLPF